MRSDIIRLVQSTGPQNAYEVYCYPCQVTAPVGSRRCLHCGGRLSKQRTQPAVMTTKPLEESIKENDVPDELQQRSGTNLPMTAVWILLLVGGSLYRLCG